MALVSVAVAGCARIKTTVSYTDTLVSRATKVTTVDDSLRYLTSSPAVAGTSIVVKIKSEETCRTKITPIYRRTAHIAREPRPDATGTALRPSTIGVLGALVAGSGIYMAADADRLAAMDMQTGDPNATSADGYRGLGALMIGTGAVMGIVALVDAYRLRDEVRDEGEHGGEPDVSQEPCHRKTLANSRVIARVDRLSNFEVQAATNDEGTVRFPMLELPGTALGGHNLTVNVAIGDAQVPVRLGSSEIDSLRANLEADPDSKISRDREAKKTATCQYLVDTVAAERVTSETSDRQVARLQRDWEQAKATCGDKWIPEHEQRLAKFKADVEASAKERATRACQDAVATARETISLDGDVATEIDAARKACDGIESGPKLLGALDEALRRRKAERVRAEQRTASTEALATRMRAHDAVGVRAMLAKDPELKSLLRGDAGWTVVIASHWIGQLERGVSSTEVRAQLCASRALVFAFAGEAEWNRLRTKAVERNDVTKGARIAKEMNAGGCS